MRKGKYIGVCLTLFFIMCSVLGCGKSGNEEKVKVSNREKDKNISIENSKLKLKDDIVYVADNCNAALYYEETNNYVNFIVMTRKELCDNELKITFDKDVDYRVKYIKLNFSGSVAGEDDTQEVNITNRTCMSYNGIDWKKYLKLENEGANVEEYASKYNKGYKGVIGCYFYKVSVAFECEKITEDCKINKMYLEYKNNKTEKNVNINLKVNTSKYIPDVFESTSESTVVETSVVPNNKGILYTYNDIKLKALKNVKIKEIKCVGDNGIEIENIDVYGSFNNNIQQKFNGDLDIKQGEDVNFSIDLKDQNFINQLAYNNNIVISMIYEVDGQLGEDLYSIHIVTGAMLDELYAYYNDGVDIMSYYNDYHNVVNGLN